MGNTFASTEHARRSRSANNAGVPGQDYKIELTLTSEQAARKYSHELKIEGETLFIEIPANVKTGDSFRFVGAGGKGKKGGPYGDLHVFIRVENDEKPKRRRSHASERKYTFSSGGTVTTVTIKVEVPLS